VLWYAGGIPTEPPWVGSPLDSAWVDGEFEYWSPIPEPLTE